MLQADMVHTIRAYCERSGIDINIIVPESFTLGGARENYKDRRALRAAHARHVSATGRAVWIIKPTGGGKGGKIFLLDECVCRLRQCQAASCARMCRATDVPRAWV